MPPDGNSNTPPHQVISSLLLPPPLPPPPPPRLPIRMSQMSPRSPLPHPLFPWVTILLRLVQGIGGQWEGMGMVVPPALVRPIGP